MRTLNNLSDLRESRFGRPPPRHGLNLLWWFAHECVQIDSNGRMIPQYNPAHGTFGFCLFHNRERLLPHSDLPYYEVGNLNKTDSLPEYVTEDYIGCLDDSNTDRIIVSFDSRWNRFGRIYVTKHLDEPKKFDQNHTYCISCISDLIKIIQELSREEFHSDLMNPSVTINIPQSVPMQSETCLNKKYCCLLMGVIVLLLIIAAMVFSL